MIQLPDLVGEVEAVTPCKVLFVCANRRASRPVLQALGRAGFLLQVVSGLSQISSVCRRAFDAIVVTEPRSASIWIDRLKLRNPGIAVVLLCSGEGPLSSFPLPVDAICQIESPRLAVEAISEVAYRLPRFSVEAQSSSKGSDWEASSTLFDTSSTAFSIFGGPTACEDIQLTANAS